MTIYQMKCFLTFSELLNYTRTAEVLNMTQPALSKMIVSIEDEAGTPLVQRTKRSVNLTNAGRIYRKYCEKILADYKECMEQLQVAGRGHSGSIRLGFSSTILDDILPPLIHHMSEEYPDVDIFLHDGTQVELLQMLQNDELDLIFVDQCAIDSFSGFQIKSILQDEIGVLVNEKHPFAKRDYIYLEELRNEKLMISGRLIHSPSSPATTNSIITTLLYENELLPYVSYTTRTISNMIMMADCNVGVAILPRHFLRYAPSSIRFVPLTTASNPESGRYMIKIMAMWKEPQSNSCVETAMELLDGLISGDRQKADSQVE